MFFSVLYFNKSNNLIIFDKTIGYLDYKPFTTRDDGAVFNIIIILLKQPVSKQLKLFSFYQKFFFKRLDLIY